MSGHSEHTRAEPAGPSGRESELRLRWIGGCIVVAVAAAIALGVLWFTGGSTELLAVLLAVIALAVGAALHHVIATTDHGELVAARPDTRDRDLPNLVERRHVLAGLAVLGGLGAAALVGVLRVGRPAPPGSAWRAGAVLTTLDGVSLRPEDVPIGGVVTVWPPDAVGTERAAVMVIRLREAPEVPTRLDGVVEGSLVAYSRLCTHAGCAVALYRDVDQALFCPCHQATFDARRGARPTAGPASIPLPQLPLGVDDDGVLIAVEGLTARPGPVGGSVT